MKRAAPSARRGAAPSEPLTVTPATVPAGPASQSPAPVALDLLLELTERFGMVSIDARDLPVCVWVQTDAGPRHYFGGSVTQALCIATSATVPREPAEPEPFREVVGRVLSKLKPEDP